MEENELENVYVTPCGKKFHYNSQCTYIKFKPTIRISYKEALQKFEGPCSRCFGYNNPLLNKNNQIYNRNNFNNNFFPNNKCFQYNSKQIYNNAKNFKKLRKETFNIINNNDKEDKKNNDRSEGNSLEKKDIYTDLLISSGNGTILAGGDIDLQKKVLLFEDKNNSIDFNNNNFCTLNKNLPYLNNKNIINNFDISNDICNFDRLSNNKEDEDKKIIEKDDDKKIKKENEVIGNDFNIINNSNFNKNNYKMYNESSSLKSSNDKILNNKDDDKFFSNSINNCLENIQNNKNIKNNNNNIIIYNIENTSQNKSKNISLYNSEKLNIYSSKLSSDKKLKKNKKNNNRNKKNMNILLSTNENAKKILFNNSILSNINTTHNSNSINQGNNEIKNLDKNNIIEENFKIGELNNNKYNNGSFKFSFEINPKTQNKICIEIEVGFEIDYVDDNSTNILNEEGDNEFINNNNEEIVLDSVIEKFSILRQFKIYKKTNIINVLINIDKGKFFVVGNKELKEGNNNILLNKKYKILYMGNFQGISFNKLKEIKPIFKFNKNDLNVVDIMLNEIKLGNDFK